MLSLVKYELNSKFNMLKIILKKCYTCNLNETTSADFLSKNIIKLLVFFIYSI